MKCLHRLLLPVCVLLMISACSEDDAVGPGDVSLGDSQLLAPRAGALVLPGRIDFAWTASQGAALYRLQAGSVISNGISTEHDTLVSGTACGLFFDLNRIGKEMAWRLQPIGADSAAGVWTDYSLFTLKSFSQDPANREKVKAGLVTFSWEALPGAEKYIVQVGYMNVNSFIQVQDTAVATTSCSLVLNGKWCAWNTAWRLRPVCPGSGMSHWSEPATFLLDGWSEVRLRMENTAPQYLTLRGRGDPLLRYPRYEDISFNAPEVSGTRWTFTRDVPVSLEHLLRGLDGTDRMKLVIDFNEGMDRILDATLTLEGTGFASVGGIGGEGRYIRRLALHLRDIPTDAQAPGGFALEGAACVAGMQSFTDTIQIYAGYWQIDPLSQGGGQHWVSLADERFVLDHCQVSEATRIRLDFE